MSIFAAKRAREFYAQVTPQLKALSDFRASVSPIGKWRRIRKPGWFSDHSVVIAVDG